MADNRQNVNINYLSRDFTEIKSDLIEYAKRYFSDAGFGSLMVDAVSYIGDILSFYLDYQANESFLSTAIEYDNVLKHGETVGYRYQPRRSSFGDVNLFILIPANSSNTGPDTSQPEKSFLASFAQKSLNLEVLFDLEELKLIRLV